MNQFQRALISLLPVLSLASSAFAQYHQEFKVRIPPERSNMGVIEGNVSRATSLGTITNTANLQQRAGARNVGADAYRVWIEQSHPNLQAAIAKSGQPQVLVVKGHWDNSGKILKKFNIPFEKIGMEQVAGYNLASVKVVIVDCQGKMDLAGKQKLRDFVMRGGSLLSTDWALDNCIQGAFPNFIAWNKGVNKQATYDAQVVDPDPVLFNKTVSHAPWKLDLESHLVGIKNPQAVKVLASSEELKGHDPDRIGALAVYFRFGRGSVLHMVGHFENNSPIPLPDLLPDPAPIIGISLRQALAANYVASAIEGR